jgi:pantetheine-phosphate adenylyltransferase
MFDTIHIVVVHNPAKNPRLTTAQRVELISEILKSQSGHFVVSALDKGLLVDYCKSLGADALVKGVRTNVDLDYELPMAQVNRDLSGIETIFIPADPTHGFVSSSLVKQVFDLGGDISKYVPLEVEKALSK